MSAPNPWVPFSAVDPSERQLNEIAHRLEYSGSFKVHFHQAWPQSFVQHDPATTWITVSGLYQAGDNTQSVEVTADSLEVIADPLEVITNPLEVIRDPLVGAIGIQLKRYLHVTTRLALQEFVLDDASLDIRDQSLSTRSFGAISHDDMAMQEPSIVQYPMIQHRKMRSRRLHYLDHPKLAVIVRFDPYDPTIGIIPEL